ncbi:spore germination protein [Sutcliffiella horikoshii]|uniref:spore germination protein n=1 Tax=Sutcliffiella horikoshii TaxID=79883 RepID=UPI003850DD95
MHIVESIKNFLPDANIYVYTIITLLVPLALSKITGYFQGDKAKPINEHEQQDKEFPAILSNDLSANVDEINKNFGTNKDIITREFTFGKEQTRAAIIFAKGLVDTTIINSNILEPLLVNLPDHVNPLTIQIKNLLPISEISEENRIEVINTSVLRGQTVLFLQDIDYAFVLKTSNAIGRNLEEPVSELQVRGPRIGFNENLIDNVTLLRKAGVNTELRFITLQLGKRFNKELVITYVEGIANPEIIENVKQKIESIDIDNIPESGYVEELIEENNFSLFPQVQSTERPDRVVAALTEGRVAIILDGTPFALIVPATINMFLQSPEDYYERWIAGSLVRFLRYVAAFIAVFTPALYISFVSFHQGLIPTKLALSIISSREGVPFPILIEALLMEVSIEILREAGLRLPKPIGQTIGIVGGLVIGDAAVQAGIVSPVTVIVVALTAISSFSLPQYNISISLRILRFIAMFLAATLGLYGVIVFFIFFSIHLVRLKSFGVPYLSPAVPYQTNDWKDFFIRLPISAMKKRPKIFKPTDTIRKG